MNSSISSHRSQSMKSIQKEFTWILELKKKISKRCCIYRDFGFRHGVVHHNGHCRSIRAASAALALPFPRPPLVARPTLTSWLFSSAAPLLHLWVVDALSPLEARLLFFCNSSICITIWFVLWKMKICGYKLFAFAYKLTLISKYSSSK